MVKTFSSTEQVNATGVSNNASAIGTNTGNIGTNAINIGNNTTAIGVNAGAISTLNTTVGNLAVNDLTDATITAPDNSNVLVRNVGNTAWVNDKVDLLTQVKNKTSARVYYDIQPFLTTAFPGVYSAGNTAYPPIGSHTASKIYINTTEKVVFLSSQCNPAFDNDGPGGAGAGANAMTAYIIVLVGNSTAPAPGAVNYVRPPIIKFTASTASATSDAPARQVSFRPSDNTGGAGGMPNSGTTSNSAYNGTTFADNAWSWFKYEEWNGTLQIQSDITTTYPRWWTSSDTHEAFPILYKLEDPGNVTLTSIKDSDHLVRFGTDWVNRSPNDGQIKINTGTGASQPTFTLVANVAQSLQYIPPLSVSGFPTSSIPLNNGVHPITFVDSLIYQSARFVENDVSGQVNIWRFILDYSGKQSGNSGVITVIINNALSGFTAKGSFPLPQGLTGETDRYTEIITIADGASLPSGTGQGYDFSIEASTDCNVVVTSITRINPAYSERV